MTREQIDSRIERLVAQYCTMHDDAASAARATDPASRVTDLVASQAVASSRGGKRLRAKLLLQAFASARGDESRFPAARDIACALEIFQTAALVHDDIIDDSDLRRGAPSAHRALSDALGSRAQGDGLAIMLGDLLATASVDVMHEAARLAPHSDAIVEAFLRMHRAVEIGQVMDVAVETLPLADHERLAECAERTYRWKTASYTTVAPLLLGLLCAGADPDAAKAAATAIGEPLGIAFQINDDLIDVIGTSASTGKPVGGDIREGKRTLLLADALQGADDATRRALIAAYSDSHESARDVARITEAFRTSGAVDRSRERIETLWHATCTALDEHCAALGISGAEKDGLARQCALFVPGIG
ncbi:MAG: polyprenyl synthetase family protein [Bifidobacteriaceae bacterium]|nr:polyprenyl synthetase family protein [Bifidobacteriaceae bacterium]